MCILFLSIVTNPKPDEYKLILASNRDEYYKRPAKPAHFWKSNPNIIGGQDMEPGREGGTWLALSKQGKIGVLLNILNDFQSPDKLGRGFLVNDYVNSPELSGFEYCQKINKQAELYNPFNLVTIDLKTPEGPTVNYYSSLGHADYPVKLGGDNVYAFGNSLMHIPFKKVQDGKTKVRDTVKLYSNKENKEDLIASILEILKDTEEFHPDPQMRLQAPKYPDIVLQGMSSKFVFVPSENYGSRTHTIILIDANNHVEYHEWTMEEPIENPESPTWKHSVFEFSLY